MREIEFRVSLSGRRVNLTVISSALVDYPLSYQGDASDPEILPKLSEIIRWHIEKLLAEER